MRTYVASIFWVAFSSRSSKRIAARRCGDLMNSLVDLSVGQTPSRVISALRLRPYPSGGFVASSGYTTTSRRRICTASSKSIPVMSVGPGKRMWPYDYRKICWHLNLSGPPLLQMSNCSTNLSSNDKVMYNAASIFVNKITQFIHRWEHVITRLREANASFVWGCRRSGITILIITYVRIIFGDTSCCLVKSYVGRQSPVASIVCFADCIVGALWLGSWRS